MHEMSIVLKDCLERTSSHPQLISSVITYIPMQRSDTVEAHSCIDNSEIH